MPTFKQQTKKKENTLIDFLWTTTTNSRIIKARPEKSFQAFANPQSIAAWLAPGDMTALFPP